jgi:predicted CXXCH cytochrome family protein
MKRRHTAGLSLVLTLVFAGGWALADLEGSKHDFSNEAWADGDACSACHAPDRAELPEAAPLWNPGADLSRKFGTAVSGQQPSPGRGTSICLRCHDGTLADDAVAGVKAAKRDARFVNKRSAGMFTVGLQAKDHPVGVEYPRIDKDFQPAGSVIAKRAVLLPDSRVECTSCHDPHNASGQDYMLVMSNARSALCLICHKK